MTRSGVQKWREKESKKEAHASTHIHKMREKHGSR